MNICFSSLTIDLTVINSRSNFAYGVESLSDKRRLGKRISVNPAQLESGSINFLVRLKKERPDLVDKIEELINEINNPPTEVNFEDIDPFSSTPS